MDTFTLQDASQQLNKGRNRRWIPALVVVPFPLALIVNAVAP
ncbi:hypothetical protein [Brevibacillus porteri]